MSNAGNFLSSEFLKGYEGIRPKNAGILFDVIRLRYAYKNETWLETCARQVEYSMNLYSGHKTIQERIIEAESMFDQMFHLLSLPSGRSMRIGGTPAGVKYEESNFNCTYSNVEYLEDINEIFHLSLCSCGVGFNIVKELIEKLPELTTNFKVIHLPYSTIYPHKKEDDTRTQGYGYEDKRILKLTVGDSKQGWVQALRKFLDVLRVDYPWLNDRPLEIYINYDFIRPEGTKLETWGGRAAGPQGLQRMFEKLEIFIKRCKGKLRPIDALDINTSIGANVVVGGTRRAAMIALFSPDDYQCIQAKFGDRTGWLGYTKTKKKVNYHKDYELVYGKEIAREIFKKDKYEGVVDWIPHPVLDNRTMSNNSIVFKTRPTLEKLKEIVSFIRTNGEPGFFNLEAALKRRPYASGINPCAEILMDNKGVCNLSTVPLTSHLYYGKYGYELDRMSLIKAYRNAVRVGLRQTNVTLSLPNWDKVQKRDRLLGVSITGEMDALDKLGWKTGDNNHKDLLTLIKTVCDKEADEYAYEMRVPRPLLVTCVKPEGSLSLLMGVSCGVHRSYAPHYIRRLKFANFEPTCKALIEAGVPYENDKSKKDSNRIVFEFPIASGAKLAGDDEPFIDQFNRYLFHQKHLVDHNTSITLYVGDDEWEQVPQVLYDNWDNVIAVSFLPKGYKGVQLPYEARPAAEIEERIKNMPDLSNLGELVMKYENGEHEEYEILDSGCENGYCPLV